MRGLTTAALTAAALLFAPAQARALDPTVPAADYSARWWTTEQGLPSDSVHGPVVQTTDGAIWIGTETGLVRSDGIRTEVYKTPTAFRE